MSIIRNRELSQFGSVIFVDNSTGNVGISTNETPYIGIGTVNPIVKLHVVGDTNLDGDLTVSNGTIEASSYTLNGTPLVSAGVAQWTFGTSNNDIYRLQGNIGIGTSVFPQRLTINGNVSAGQFISTISTGTAPFVVQSETVVTNLNAFYLRGGVPGQDLNSNDIITRGGTQTLTNKTLTSPTISSILNSGAKTVPTGIGTFVITGSVGLVTTGMIASGAITNDRIVAGAGIPYSKLSLNNSILSSDIAVGTGITYGKLSLSNSIVGSDIVNGTLSNAKLQNSTISGISLGSNLSTLTFGTFLQASGTSYNGSTNVTIALNASSLNTASTIVARDSSGNFSAGTVTVNSINVSGGNISGQLTNSVLSGVGLTGGSFNNTGITTISLGTPSSITSSSTNSVTESSHTHELANSSVTSSKLDGGQSGSAPVFGARAWGRMINGETATPSLSYGGNISSSVTKVSTGVYRFTFTTAMPTANYVIIATAGSSTLDNMCSINILSATQFQIHCYDPGVANDTIQDTDQIFFAVFG